MDFNDQFTLEETFSSIGTNLFLNDHHIDNFNINEPLLSLQNSALSLQPTGFKTFENSTFEYLPNFDFFESKPYINHVRNDSAFVPLIDNFNQSVGLNNVLGHSQMMVTPINMVSPNNLAHNPFNYRDFSLIRSYNKPLDQGSCTSPKVDMNMVAKSLSTTTMLRKGFRGRKKKTNLIVKGQWTIEEDRLLIQLVERYGVTKWSQIAELLNGRIGKQCRERWHNHLKPDIKKDVWSEEEDRVLIKAHAEIGNKWAEIAKKLHGRTENSIKNHWNATKRRQFSSRKCRSKYPTQSSLLQDYIKSLSPEIINAGCRKKPNKKTKSSDDQTVGSSSRCHVRDDQYDFSEVSEFNFDAQLFEESDIDSLLDCVSEEAANATVFEIRDDPDMGLGAMVQSQTKN
ncbi:hypothetical protein RND81_13G131400 [Saponaria officinalis]|uniref:Uncharacterized protein n=1 Tax=Saponaria officinalis TaxID=3572 RepID=A0AAW1H641_SAPOF